MPNRPSILFLDFDGVLLDSADETATTAWRGGRRIWPGEWTGDPPPRWLILAFRRLRPLLHTGYEAFGLLRLAWMKGEKMSSRLEPDPDNQRQAAELLRETGLSRERLTEIFGSTRDCWLQLDFDGWMNANRFYPGVVAALRRRLQHSPESLYILTTKQQRFVLALASRCGLALHPSRVFGLDTGKSKRQHLSELCPEPRQSGQSMHFVEDRLPTLLEVGEDENLGELQLHLAEWGYATGEHIGQATRHPRIDRMSLPRFIELLAPVS